MSGVKDSKRSHTSGRTRRPHRKRGSGLRLFLPEVIALGIVIFCLGFLLGRYTIQSTEYEGLGEPVEIPLNPYDQESYYYTDDGRLHYDDAAYTSVQVLDVSYAQKDINWDKVAKDGIDQVIIRLGYRGYESGLLNLDAYFEQNLKGAKEAGLDVGVYFFSQAVSVDEAREEAEFVLKQIKGEKIRGPVVFDMEPIKGADRITYLTVAEKTAIADAFCDLIGKKGYEAMVYGNPQWLNGDLDLSLLTEHPVWLAHYTEYTEWPYWYSMWQYTCEGKVAGIKGDADLSVKIIPK